MKLTVIVCFLLHILWIPETKSQINISIGYDLSYYPVSEINMLIDQINADLAFDKDLKKVHLINGLQVGFKYKSETTSAFLSISGKMKSTKSNLTNASGESLTYKISNQFLTGSFGLSANAGIIGFGSSIDYNINQMQLDFEQMFDHKHKFNGWSNRVFLNIETPGSNNVSLSIQPYAQFFWKKWDLRDVQADFSNQTPVTPLNQTLNNFGITFIFNNGPQY